MPGCETKPSTDCTRCSNGSSAERATGYRAMISSARAWVRSSNTTSVVMNTGTPMRLLIDQLPAVAHCSTPCSGLSSVSTLDAALARLLSSVSTLDSALAPLLGAWGACGAHSLSSSVDATHH